MPLNGSKSYQAVALMRTKYFTLRVIYVPANYFMKKISQPQFERLQKINTRLNQWGGKPVPTAELMRLCECSEKTLKNDIGYLRDTYNAKIYFDRKQKGYRYLDKFDLDVSVALSERELAALEAAVGTLAQFSHLAPFRELRSAVSKLEQAVRFKFRQPAEQAELLHFENVPIIPGGDLIAPLLDIIRSGQWVRFQHRKFDAIHFNTYHLFPYIIKEHRNRWYLVGWEKTRQEIRAFGLERISEASLMAFESNETAPAFAPKAYYEKSLGIAIYDKEAPEDVILSFTPYQANYFKTQPFYPYQKENVLIDNENEFRVKLHLIINKEMVYELARLGAEVCVLAPKRLVREMKEFHEGALKRYE